MRHGSLTAGCYRGSRVGVRLADDPNATTTRLRWESSLEEGLAQLRSMLSSRSPDEPMAASPGAPQQRAAHGWSGWHLGGVGAVIRVRLCFDLARAGGDVVGSRACP